MKQAMIALAALTILATARPAEACLTFKGKAVGKVRSVVRRALTKGEYMLSFRVTWNKKTSKGVMFQGVRLHRRIKVIASTGTTLAVKRKGIAPAHNVVAFGRTTAWVTIKVRIAPKDRDTFEHDFKNRDLILHRHKGKAGATFGDYFAPNDPRPKGCATPGSPKWPGAESPKPKASDF